MPLCGVHPAQETNENAIILFVSYVKMIKVSKPGAKNDNTVIGKSKVYN